MIRLISEHRCTLFFYSIELLFDSGLENGLNTSDSVGPYGTLLVYLSFVLEVCIVHVFIFDIFISRIYFLYPTSSWN
jgi:hypothetical protein